MTATTASTDLPASKPAASSSFLEAAASAEIPLPTSATASDSNAASAATDENPTATDDAKGDVENQKQINDSNIEVTLSSEIKKEEEEDNGNESDTASVFSFDSYEKQPRISLRLQNILMRKTQDNASNVNSTNGVPFPSVTGDAPGEVTSSGGLGRVSYIGQDIDVPCRCLFFTVKETLCMTMSALGCAVFLCGLILLCMYLEGSAFDGN